MPCAPNRRPPRWRSTTPSLSISSATRRSRPASGSALQPSPPRASPTTVITPSRLERPPLPLPWRLSLRSRRSFVARISISTATAGLRRAGAIARARTLPRSGSQRQSRPNAVRRRPRSRKGSSASRALARRSSLTASSGARARTRFGKAGRRSAESSRALSTPGPTPRSRAARSTPTSRRNTSFARSGRLYSGSASAAAECSSPASAAACFRR